MGSPLPGSVNGYEDFDSASSRFEASFWSRDEHLHPELPQLLTSTTESQIGLRILFAAQCNRARILPVRRDRRN